MLSSRPLLALLVAGVTAVLLLAASSAPAADSARRTIDANAFYTAAGKAQSLSALPQATGAQAKASCTPPAKLGVVFVVDDSGSMEWNDPTSLRANAVEIGIQAMGGKGVVAGVSFADAPTTLFPHSDVGAGQRPTRDQIAAALKNDGGTNYIDAFTATKAALDAMPADVDRKAVVLLSDGQPTDAFTVAANGKSLGDGVTIYSIGFGSADMPLLSQLSAGTGGLAQAAKSAADVQGALFRAIGAINCRPVSAPSAFDMKPGETRRIDFTIPKGQAGYSALASWDSGTLAVAFERPDGSVMRAGQTGPNEQVQEAATSVRADVTQPAAGRWTAVLTAPRDSVRNVNVAIDLTGGGSIDDPIESRPQPAGPGCITEIVVAGRVAWSTCFKRSGVTYTTAMPMRIAGIDLKPTGRHKISIDATNGLITSPDAEISVFVTSPILSGRATLYSGKLRLPVGTSFHIAGKRSSYIGKHRATGKIAQLPIAYDPGFELDWDNSGVKLTLAIKMPSAVIVDPGTKNIDGTTADQPLRRGYGMQLVLRSTNSDGVAIDSLSGSIANAKVYTFLTIKKLQILLDLGKAQISGSAEAEPFPHVFQKALPTLAGKLAIGFDPWGLNEVGLTVKEINRPLGSSPVFLQKIGGSVKPMPSPFTISGEMGISLGPTIKGIPFIGDQTAISVDGTSSWSWPMTFTSSADGKIFGQPFGDATFDVDLMNATGSLEGDLKLSFGGTGLDGRVAGWFDRGPFQLEGRAGMSVFGKTVSGADAFVNTTAAGGCRRGFGPDWGFTVDFAARRVNAMAASCDFGSLKLEGHASQAAGGPLTATVAKRERGRLIRVDGRGGQPLLAIGAPDGSSTAAGADTGLVETEGFVAIPDEGSHAVWLVLRKTGRWTITARDATPIAVGGSASALRAASVRGSVRVRRGREIIRYRATIARGDRLRIVERGPGGQVRVWRPRHRSGTIRTSPLAGPAGARTITATVHRRGGTVRWSGQIASYTAKRAVRPAPVRGLRATRKGSRATVRWRAPRGVGGRPVYRVRYRLTDGRIVERLQRKRVIRYGGMRRSTHGRVTVSVIGSPMGTPRTVRIPRARRHR